MRYLLLLLIPVFAFAQSEAKRIPFTFQDKHQLQTVDRLLRLESYSRAETLLQQLEKTGTTQLEIPIHWIKLWQGTGRDSLVVDLFTQIPERQQTHRLLKELAESHMKLGNIDVARGIVDKVLQSEAGRVNSAQVMVQLWRDSGHPLEGVALCDLLMQDDQTFMRRQRSICLMQAGNVKEAMAGFNVELNQYQLNLAIVRKDLAQVMTDPAQAAESLQKLDPENSSRLLLADLLLQSGQASQALDAVDNMFSDRVTVSLLYGFSSLLVSELRFADQELQQDYIDWLLTVLEKLFHSESLPLPQRKSALNLLSDVTVQAVKTGTIDGPVAVERLESIMELLQEHRAGDTHYFAVWLELARFTCDQMNQPQRAVTQLENMLSQPGISGKGISKCKVELGRCMIAAGDTVTARLELAYVGSYSNDRNAAGMAHFILAKLDLTQGQWEQAKDRLAAVAIHNPGAPIANDALDLGLLIAEEIENPAGGVDQLQIYAKAILANMISDVDAEIAALRELIAIAENAGPDVQQYLLERAKWELANLLPSTEALQLCSQLYLDYPDGRYPAAALNYSADLLIELGDTSGAREKWEQLLLQYPNNLYANDARLKLEQLQ
ncbi:MAG: tetratricopeptide repeat protein [bacterium]|nr:tetratricopeptide repeat protein [bacterium]MCP4800328.1 tetratricopeptide repeat protein [bacterium]